MSDSEANSYTNDSDRGDYDGYEEDDDEQRKQQELFSQLKQQLFLI